MHTTYLLEVGWYVLCVVGEDARSMGDVWEHLYLQVEVAHKCFNLPPVRYAVCVRAYVRTCNEYEN